ncbi:3-hydroxyisobutyrate dehydrogenase-like beta-hydroxyacid dehydrogenase [Chitinophaga japonensis]|uniref:3-hydroxyisobutyrate dehydrogenase-like beta-hydroxyacid dehydrogenase n=2 Tax=Chitinophaga japonensis TaxID=104662 RepID=A0A562SZ98_CHIJA|nr:3-hydroxyisobutyrate dehydrogenase-like beta-hydroxyacid dehydrogenase [Chitinophaga japonensis]
MKIGFIGLGHLGTPIAENLLMQHQPVYVYNRTAAKAQPLLEKGAVICTSVKELAGLCDVVFSIVSDDAALHHITEGPDGIAAHLKAGGVHISMSTILPATSTALAALHHKHNNHYIAAPVMGRPEAARARKLNFLVSGQSDVIETIKPLLQDAGAVNTWEFGAEAGAANTAKLCSNYLILSGVAAMAEGINMAQRSGIDPHQWMQMLTQTLFNAPFYHIYSAALLKEAYLPAGFSLQMGLKDANLVMQQAQSVEAQMPLGQKLQELLQQSLAQGLGDHDVIAMALAIQKGPATLS